MSDISSTRERLEFLLQHHAHNRQNTRMRSEAPSSRDFHEKQAIGGIVQVR
jgi:hypothetical protein